MRLNYNLIILSYLSITTFLLILSCKSSQPATEQSTTYDLLIMLASDRATPDNIELLKLENVIKKNRASRSQNQWLIQITKNASEIDAFLEALRESNHVKSVELSQPSS